MFDLSVIIPNYNNGKYLPQCIQSIVSQTYDDIKEIIIVDDCSTDNSKQIIIQLCEVYKIIVPIFLKKNMKVSSARNQGITRATSNYVTCIDADDYYYDRNKISNEMNVIKKFHDKGIDVVSYSTIVTVSNSGQVLKLPPAKRSKYYNGNIYKRLLLNIDSSKVMRDYIVKKDLIISAGMYNTSNSLFEDFELILKLAKKYKFYHSGGYGTAYRDSVNGLSKRKSEELTNKKRQIIISQIKQEPAPKRNIIYFEWALINFLKKCLKR